MFQYGFVFGIVSLAAFIFSPIFGRYGTAIGPKLLYNTGGFVQGIGGICFGFLDYVQDTGVFIGISYFLRLTKRKKKRKKYVKIDFSFCLDFWRVSPVLPACPPS